MPVRAAITKIVVQLGDKELTLSLKEAQELRDILNATLQPSVGQVVEHHHHYENPWSSPCDRRWDRWTVNYGEGTLWATNAADSTLKAVGPGTRQG